MTSFKNICLSETCTWISSLTWRNPLMHPSASLVRLVKGNSVVWLAVEIRHSVVLALSTLTSICPSTRFKSGLGNALTTHRLKNWVLSGIWAMGDNRVHFLMICRHGRIFQWMQTLIFRHWRPFMVQLYQPSWPLYIPPEFFCITLSGAAVLGVMVTSICNCWKLDYFQQVPLDLRLPLLSMS